jgi:hypothetical protein
VKKAEFDCFVEAALPDLVKLAFFAQIDKKMREFVAWLDDAANVRQGVIRADDVTNHCDHYFRLENAVLVELCFKLSGTDFFLDGEIWQFACLSGERFDLLFCGDRVFHIESSPFIWGM